MSAAKVKLIKYYQVTATQLFMASLLVGVIASALMVINTGVKEYLQLPVVSMTAGDECISVSNLKNGESFVCSDVGTILRNYRVQKN